MTAGVLAAAVARVGPVAADVEAALRSGVTAAPSPNRKDATG